MDYDNGFTNAKYPSREEAERLLKEAESCNPGPWGNHSRTAAHCAEGVMDQIDRMMDVKSRYGKYDQDKWNTNIRLRKYFEGKMGEDLYIVVDKENYKPV